MRRFPWLVAVLVIVLGLGGPSPGALAKGGGGAIAFGRPTISGVQGNGFEQDVRVDAQGRIYTSVPDSLSSGTSWIWRSLDGGQTFKWVPAATPLQGKLPTCAGGGDSELATDSAGNLYFADLTLANFSTARSGDRGASFTGSCAGVLDTPVDRQWYAVDGDPLSGGNIYLTYDVVGAGSPVCGSSLGNNVVVLTRSPLPGANASAGIEFNPSNKLTPVGSCEEGIMGNDAVSPVSHHVFVIHDNATLDQIRLGRCQTVPLTTDPSGLSCFDLPVASFPGHVTGGNFPTLAIDQAGTLYAVWEEAPGSQGAITGNTSLFMASSADEGTTWTTPVQIPTPGLLNNVFAWVAAGAAGRVDIAWYGTPAPAGTANNGCTGPDSVRGDWSLFLAQSANANSASPTFTPPTLASEHFVHRGSIQTVMGGQCGDRTLGDFLQIRIGAQGEANIAYADSNNIDEPFAPHGMFVRQIGGPGLFGSSVSAGSAPKNSVGDPAGDATYDANRATSQNIANLDILASSVSKPDASNYRITMKVANLTSLAPTPTSGDSDTDLVWLTQWLVPSSTDPNGGKNFFAYMESTAGAPPKFYVGENAATLDGGGVALTYPGATQVTGSYTATSPGTITINVPIKDVTEPGAINQALYSVTASTMTLPQPANSIPSSGGIGGSFFNLIDVAPAYDFTSQTGG